MISESDVEHVAIDDAQLAQCIANARAIAGNLVDRPDLHARDNLERFINVLMGEVAEIMTLSWFGAHGKSAVSAVDKGAPNPDAGHDIHLTRKDGRQLACSVKSSSLASHRLPADGRPGRDSPVNTGEFRRRSGFRRDAYVGI